MKAQAWAGGLALAWLVAAGVCAAEPQADEGSFWMQKKLQYSEALLAGLAKEDFDQIAKNARSMRALNEMERWVRGGTPQYRAQLSIFKSATDEIIEAADAGQLDAAALGYVQLTLSCVNCHKVIRDNAGEKPPEAR